MLTSMVWHLEGPAVQIKFLFPQHDIAHLGGKVAVTCKTPVFTVNTTESRGKWLGYN